MIINTPGTYLLLFAPFKIDGATRADADVVNDIRAGVGLLTSLNGHNVAYERIFDNVLGADGQGVSLYSDVIVNPLTNPVPDVSAEGIVRLDRISTAIDSLRGPDLHRTKLSLRWVEKATNEKGVDSFLSLWIAIETLGMPDTTDIRPLNESLARTYGRTRDDVASLFLVGRLFGLRSLIVHKGATPAVHWKLLDYLAAVYRDVLLDALRLPTEGAAASAMTEDGATLRQALDAALGVT